MLLGLDIVIFGAFGRTVASAAAQFGVCKALAATLHLEGGYLGRMGIRPCSSDYLEALTLSCIHRTLKSSFHQTI